MKPTIIIYSNNTDKSLRIKDDLQKAIQAYQIDQVSVADQADYIITVGGDGTLLSAFHRFKDQINTTMFIGIHTGHLGFYTDWVQEDLQVLLEKIEQGQPDPITYPLLKIELELKKDQRQEYLALNEFTFRSVSGTMVCDIKIKEHFFETFRGDGLCISTPTGSTGLNKSLGGAVIHPRIDAIQLTEMASLNNRIYRSLGSPLVIPHDECIELIPKSQELGYITIDNQTWQNFSFERVRCFVAKERIRFASFKHTHFWDRVENAFIGNKLRLESGE